MEDYKQTFSSIIEHNLRFYKFDTEDVGWTIAKSKLAGKGVIATRCFQPGDVIFIDYPLVVGPRSSPNLPLLCVVCYTGNIKNLKPCSRNCSLPVCSLQCENDERHVFECTYLSHLRKNTVTNQNLQLLRSVTPVRCLKFDKLCKDIVNHRLHKINGPQQGFEVVLLENLTEAKISKEDKKFMHTSCRALDANAFEIPLANNKNTKGVSLRGLFPMASTMNHSCSPNTAHEFGGSHQMTIKASKAISVGEEITTTYVSLLLGTLARRNFLAKSKHFYCQCSRCKDPTEFDTYLSALKCRNKSCNDGKLLPTNPCNFLSDWSCHLCKTTLSADKIGVLQRIVAQELSKFDSTKPAEVIAFIKNNRIVADTNHTKVQFKYSLISGIIGYTEGYTLAEIEESLLLYKTEICEEILSIAEKLKLGCCKIRDVCLFELSKTKEELERSLQHRVRQNLPTKE